MTRHFIIPIFVPHLGCPHDCIFCNQRKIAGTSTNINKIDVKNIINQYLGYFNVEAFIEIAFYGGSFTAIDIHTQKNLLEAPLEYKEKGLINEIRISTRPDAINDEILNHLKDYKVDTIELGAQSMNQEILDASDRGHSSLDVIKASNLIKKHGFKLGLQMMVGLPKYSLDSELKTVKEFIKLGPDCVRIYPTLVIKDTYLEKLYLKEIYKPLDLEEAINISSILLILFKLNNINVIRIGLQPTEDIQLGKDVKAGPFHPAFRQLVESKIYREIIDSYLNSNNFNKSGKLLTMKANKKDISNIVGQNSYNKEYWIKRYGFKDIKFIPKNINKVLIDLGKTREYIDSNLLQKLYVKKYLGDNKLRYNLLDFNLKE